MVDILLGPMGRFCPCWGKGKWKEETSAAWSIFNLLHRDKKEFIKLLYAKASFIPSQLVIFKFIFNVAVLSRLGILMQKQTNKKANPMKISVICFLRTRTYRRLYWSNSVVFVVFLCCSCKEY